MVKGTTSTRIPKALLLGWVTLIAMLSAGGAFVFRSPRLMVFVLASMTFIAGLVLLVLWISGVSKLRKRRRSN